MKIELNVTYTLTAGDQKITMTKLDCIQLRKELNAILGAEETITYPVGVRDTFPYNGWNVTSGTLSTGPK